jgi:hypothetical protein
VPSGFDEALVLSYIGVDFSLRKKYILINRGGSAHYFLFTPLETIPTTPSGPEALWAGGCSEVRY